MTKQSTDKDLWWDKERTSNNKRTNQPAAKLVSGTPHNDKQSSFDRHKKTLRASFPPAKTSEKPVPPSKAPYESNAHSLEHSFGGHELGFGRRGLPKRLGAETGSVQSSGYQSASLNGQSCSGWIGQAPSTRGWRDSLMSERTREGDSESGVTLASSVDRLTATSQVQLLGRQACRAFSWGRCVRADDRSTVKKESSSFSSGTKPHVPVLPAQVRKRSTAVCQLPKTLHQHARDTRHKHATIPTRKGSTPFAVSDRQRSAALLERRSMEALASDPRPRGLDVHKASLSTTAALGTPFHHRRHTVSTATPESKTFSDSTPSERIFLCTPSQSREAHRSHTSSLTARAAWKNNYALSSSEMSALKAKWPRQAITVNALPATVDDDDNVSQNANESIERDTNLSTPAELSIDSVKSETSKGKKTLKTSKKTAKKGSVKQKQTMQPVERALTLDQELKEMHTLEAELLAATEHSAASAFPDELSIEAEHTKVGEMSLGMSITQGVTCTDIETKAVDNLQPVDFKTQLHMKAEQHKRAALQKIQTLFRMKTMHSARELAVVSDSDGKDGEGNRGEENTAGEATQPSTEAVTAETLPLLQARMVANQKMAAFSLLQAGTALRQAYRKDSHAKETQREEKAGPPDTPARSAVNAVIHGPETSPGLADAAELQQPGSQSAPVQEDSGARSAFLLDAANAHRPAAEGQAKPAKLAKNKHMPGRKNSLNVRRDKLSHGSPSMSSGSSEHQLSRRRSLRRRHGTAPTKPAVVSESMPNNLNSTDNLNTTVPLLNVAELSSDSFNVDDSQDSSSSLGDDSSVSLELQDSSQLQLSVSGEKSSADTPEVGIESEAPSVLQWKHTSKRIQKKKMTKAVCVQFAQYKAEKEEADLPEDPTLPADARRRKSAKCPITVNVGFTELIDRLGQARSSLDLEGTSSAIAIGGSRNASELSNTSRSLARRMESIRNRKRWYSALRRILLVRYLARCLREYSYSLTMDHKTFVDLGDNVVLDTSSQHEELDQRFRILAEKNKIKSKKQETFFMHPLEMKTLRTPPDERTEKNIQMLVYSLQVIDSFCNYPLGVQLQIARHSEYSFLRAKRTIIREGHVPLFFYFILSGQAVVSQEFVRNGETMRQTQALLTSGHGFGQDGLLKEADVRRTVTVTARTDMQMLHISRERYLKIFLPDTLDGGVPEFLGYLSQVPLLAGWPMERLCQNPRKWCYTRYYRHNRLIVADSSQSDHLYVVRNGLCQVVMQVQVPFTSPQYLQRLLLKEVTKDRRLIKDSQVFSSPVKQLWRRCRPDDVTTPAGQAVSLSQMRRHPLPVCMKGGFVKGMCTLREDYTLTRQLSSDVYKKARISQQLSAAAPQWSRHPSNDQISNRLSATGPTSTFQRQRKSTASSPSRSTSMALSVSGTLWPLDALLPVLSLDPVASDMEQEFSATPMEQSPKAAPMTTLALPEEDRFVVPETAANRLSSRHNVAEEHLGDLSRRLSSRRTSTTKLETKNSRQEAAIAWALANPQSANSDKVGRLLQMAKKGRGTFFSQTSNTNVNALLAVQPGAGSTGMECGHLDVVGFPSSDSQGVGWKDCSHNNPRPCVQPACEESREAPSRKSSSISDSRARDASSSDSERYETDYSVVRQSRQHAAARVQKRKSKGKQRQWRTQSRNLQQRSSLRVGLDMTDFGSKKGEAKALWSENPDLPEVDFQDKLRKESQQESGVVSRCSWVQDLKQPEPFLDQSQNAAVGRPGKDQDGLFEHVVRLFRTDGTQRPISLSLDSAEKIGSKADDSKDQNVYGDVALHSKDRRTSSFTTCLWRRRQYRVPPRCVPKRPPLKAAAPSKASVIHVALQKLTEGDIFGFDQTKIPLCAHCKSHKVALVSCGAEVIALHKKYMVQHASRDLLQRWHRLAQPYPSPEWVVRQLHLRMAWDLHQQNLAADLNQVLSSHKRCFGLYFQPGPPSDPLADVGLVPDMR